MYLMSLETPVGRLRIFGDDDFLYRISFPRSPAVLPQAEEAPRGHSLLRAAATQIREYFAGTRREFDLPLLPLGTDFQKQVWKQMRQIPYGQTRTYGELAAELGNTNKARAVGGAANKNPLPLVIPCHRVLGAGNRLTGFGGGLPTKQFLLDLEQIPT